ncbi:MAG: trypsin-like peptidase domain-containing protein [bacterium]
MNRILLVLLFFIAQISEALCQSNQKNTTDKKLSITLVNNINYVDTTFSDLPGNGFLIDIGDEILAVTCKHVFWENRPGNLNSISLDGKIKEWKMYVKDDVLQYVILGELLNTDNSEIIGERNTDKDYLVFKIKENHSKITPLKLSLTSVQPGDTLSKTGWTFKNKNAAVRVYKATAFDYSGSSLLIQNLVPQNEAGLSGSPVTNSNNQLVGIVSSWKYELSKQNWYEATCSTDYLWEVLYTYWLNKNNKEKSIKSFQEYLTSYQNLNGNKPVVSSFLYTELFYNNWLKSKGIKYGTVINYNEWSQELLKNYKIKIVLDDYRKSLLIFDSWKEKYISGKSALNDLEQALKTQKVFLPNFINFCEFAQEQTALGNQNKAIELLLFINDKIQNMGQVYAFLGDAYYAKGEKDLAKESYLKCLQTYPGYPKAIEGLDRLK